MIVDEKFETNNPNLFCCPEISVGPGVLAPPVYLTMPVDQAEDDEEWGPRRSGESISLEIKSYRGYPAPAYLDDRVESFCCALYETN